MFGGEGVSVSVVGCMCGGDGMYGCECGGRGVACLGVRVRVRVWVWVWVWG